MEDQRTATAISGFGLRVIPLAPFVVVHGPNPGDLDVQHRRGSGARFARLIPNGPGRYRTLIDQRTSSPAEVFAVESGPAAASWHVDAGPFRALFPKRFALHSAPAASPSPFDLLGPGGTQIFAQSPPSMPAPREMCGPGQEILKAGDDWIELAYEHGGRRWWQRHEIRARFVFSAQAPWESAGAALDALKEFLNSLEVR